MEHASHPYFDEIVRRGARWMLLALLEDEVDDYVENHQDITDKEGNQKVLKNGTSHQEQIIQTCAGEIKLKAPRVDDQRDGEQFSSTIFPPYVRKSPWIEELVPALYLHGVSTNDMNNALEAMIGPKAGGLFPSLVTRLKEYWEEEYEQWMNRDFSDKRHVYFCPDGLYFNARLGEDRPRMLVVVGTLADGTKEVVALKAGVRESELSRMEVLLDLRGRGLTQAAELIVAYGPLGLWAAKPEVYPEPKEHLCWVQKKANVLNKLPKLVQPEAKDKLREMYKSPTKAKALEAKDRFLELFEAKYPKAFQSLADQKQRLFTFYEFPAEHWKHLRSTNPIGSTFTAVKHRHRQTKGCGSKQAILSMTYKMARKAEDNWRRIDGYDLIVKVIRGVEFKDGEEVEQDQTQEELVA